MRCLRLLTRIRIPEISAGSLPASQALLGRLPHLPPPVRTPEGIASLLYFMKVKERVASARGQSADGNYIGEVADWVNRKNPSEGSAAIRESSEKWRICAGNSGLWVVLAVRFQKFRAK
jgi:hypothetical protein